MLTIALKLYLLSGLVAHKLLWEIMKRRQADLDSGGHPMALKITLVKLAKLIFLLAILVQTVSPDIFPIADSPEMLRVVGLIIFTMGLVLAMLARIELGKNWSDIEEGRLLDRHSVISNGVYRYIRHPIYVGDLLLLIGLELSLNSWLVLVIVVMVPVVLFQAIREEKKLMMSLAGYREYASRTKRFIPFLV